jgi:zinc protease
MATAARTNAAAGPHRAVLSNGLVVILRENHANPTVAVQGVVRAGAVFDPPGRSGLAAFVGAMLDRGTRKRSAFEQAAAIENVGAHLLFDGNAETLGFSGTSLTEDLPLLLDVLADALMNPAFPEDQVEKARDELLIQVRMAEDHTASVASHTANRLLYPEWHPFHWPSIGTRETLNAVTREDLLAFHARHYGPEMTTLVLVGDVTPEETLPAVERSLAGFPPLASPPAFTVPDAPPLRAPARQVVRLPGRSQTDIVWAKHGFARTAPDYYPALLMNYILGGGSLSSRLMDRLRDRQGLVYGVYSVLAPGIGAGPLQIRAGTNPAQVDLAVAAIENEVRRMHQEGPTAEELAEAKGYLTGVFPVRLESNGGVAAQLAAAEVYGLGLDYLERYAELIESVTLDATRAAAGRHLVPDGYALAIAGSYEGAA